MSLIVSANAIQQNNVLVEFPGSNSLILTSKGVESSNGASVLFTSALDVMELTAENGVQQPGGARVFPPPLVSATPTGNVTGYGRVPSKPRITAFTNDLPEFDGPYKQGFDANWETDDAGSSPIIEVHADAQVSTDTEHSVSGYPAYVNFPYNRTYSTVMGSWRYNSPIQQPHRYLPPLSPLGNTFRIRIRLRNSSGFSEYSDWSNYVYMTDTSL